MKPNERMKELQTDSDVTIRALAKQMGIGESSLSNYLNGRRDVPYDLLVKFVEHYHTTADYLLGLTDEMKRPFPISDGERTMLEHFRTLSREQKELVVQSIELMLKQNRRG